MQVCFALFFCLWQFCPSGVGREGGAAAWVKRTQAVPSAQGRGVCWLRELWPYQSFSSLRRLAIRRPLCLVFLHCSAHSGSSSVDGRIRHIKGHLGGVPLSNLVHQMFDGPASLLFSCRCWRVRREAMVMAPPPTRASAVVPCFRGCPAFLHRDFPP